MNNDQSLPDLPAPITTLFVDIGEVLLTDGWNSSARKDTAKHFGLFFPEMEKRHQIMYETYELGKISLEDYLFQMVFYEKRSFSIEQFLEYTCAFSKPYPEMIGLICRLKEKYGLKIFAVNNESRMLNDYRIREFKLDSVIDSFISSCIVHLRKPDADIYRLAIDIAHVLPGRVLYIDNTLMFVQIAERLGIRGILHTSCTSTRERLASYGLKE